MAITTDVIAGFPGETEADFAETLSLCAEVGFAGIHAFPYSERSRTTAVRLPDKVSADVRKERMARLLALGQALSLAFRGRFAGQTRPVLWETQRDGVWAGHTDNYIAVSMPGENLRNRITPAVLGQPFGDGVLARPLGENE